MVSIDSILSGIGVDWSGVGASGETVQPLSECCGLRFCDLLDESKIVVKVSSIKIGEPSLVWF